jgi:catechol 2,3-dioxygenase-like lactoylglutathione lyase family enzyme
MPKISRMTSGFSVPDLSAAKRFYEDVLGLKAVLRPEGLELTAINSASVFLYSSQTNKPADYTVLNFIVDDIDVAVDGLVAKGVSRLK